MRFLLVHGASVGGSCFDKLIPELESLGHTAVAPDFPGSGRRVAEKATLSGYRDAVVDVIEDGDVVLGHSMGGYVITAVADAVPDKIAHLVYLAAGVPIEGRSMLDATSLSDLDMERHVTMGETENGPEFRLASIEDAVELFLGDLERDDLEWAWASLTPQQIDPLSEPISVPGFWQSSIPRSFILCTRDHSGIVPIAGEQLARLGLETAYVMDTAHYPFISRPHETAQLLDRIVSQGGTAS